jgi:hypothetical protein
MVTPAARRKAAFVITGFKHGFKTDSSDGGLQETFLYATGTVRGSLEKFSFYDTGLSDEEVMKSYEIGDRLEVWYNPSKPRLLTQYISLRAIHSSFSFENALRNALVFSCISILPSVICILSIGYLIFTKRKSGNREPS